MASGTNANGRRLMIITSDERIIEQIHHNNNLLSFETIVLEPNNNDNELSDFPPSNDEQSTNQKKARYDSLSCAICGSSAIGRNFGVITCESCKLFFRRNALKPTKMRCNHNNTCEITLQTRRRCPACRLAKCLNRGMKREGLLRAEDKAAKRLKEKINKSVFETNNFNQISSRVSSRSQQLMLNSHDLQRIETVRMAYDKRIELAACDGLPWDPSISVTTASQNINSRAVPAMRLLAFFKQIPEFNQLSMDDKMILVKYNLMSLLLPNSALSFNINTKHIREAHTDAPWNVSLIRKNHGNETFIQIKNIFESYVQIGQNNQRIIQLALIVLIFTKGLSTVDGESEPILNDSMAVYRAQTYYVELLWKYMETAHGFEQAFRIFSTLITRFLSSQVLENKLRNNIGQILSTTDEHELLPLMKSLLRV